MGRPRALLISASSRRPSRLPPSAHVRSPPARRPRRSGFPNQRPGPAPSPGGGGGRVVLAAAPAAAEPAESQPLTCARCGGPTDRLATDSTSCMYLGPHLHMHVRMDIRGARLQEAPFTQTQCECHSLRCLRKSPVCDGCSLERCSMRC
ncbi:hypothetical protein EI555_005349 [Monodon monoceros]|uniref:Uncharacterized protein n=1 Tax=Monodon monoceros TaxID=40151 RepID=A0A4U1EPP0_MONMO|nr:hypothetical protein EI555_005349 [Monodon monoceros]